MMLSLIVERDAPICRFISPQEDSMTVATYQGDGGGGF